MNKNLKMDSTNDSSNELFSQIINQINPNNKQSSGYQKHNCQTESHLTFLGSIFHFKCVGSDQILIYYNSCIRKIHLITLEQMRLDVMLYP